MKTAKLFKNGQSQAVRLPKEYRFDDSDVYITVSELEYGCEKSAAPQKNRIALMEFLSPFDVALFGSAAAHRYGMLRAQLEREGKPTGAMDMLIAAHCLAIDATLVTNNTRDFKNINDLSLTDWT